MNAGADNTYVQSVIETVRVVRGGVLTDVPVDECGYSYKKSVFQTNGDCIAGCVYRFRSGNVTEIAAKVRARRFARSKLPKGRSVGCCLSESAAGTRGRTHRARRAGKVFRSAGRSYRPNTPISSSIRETPRRRIFANLWGGSDGIYIRKRELNCKRSSVT